MSSSSITAAVCTVLAISIGIYRNLRIIPVKIFEHFDNVCPRVQLNEHVRSVWVLKSIPLGVRVFCVEYEMLDSIDTSKILGTQEQSDVPEGRIVEGAQSGGVVFEIGKTLLATQDFKSGLIRVRIR